MTILNSGALVMRPSLGCWRYKSFLLAVLAMIASVSVGTQTTAIRAGRTIDPDTGAVSNNHVILVVDGKIRAAGSNVNIPPNSRVIDLSRKTVLPGLFDAHTHLLATVDAKWDLGDFWIMALQRRPGYRAILGVQHARQMLESGFATVRDVGNSGEYMDMDLEKAIDFGWAVGPTIVPARRIIAPFGGCKRSGDSVRETSDEHDLR